MHGLFKQTLAAILDFTYSNDSTVDVDTISLAVILNAQILHPKNKLLEQVMAMHHMTKYGIESQVGHIVDVVMSCWSKVPTYRLLSLLVTYRSTTIQSEISCRCISMQQIYYDVELVMVDHMSSSMRTSPGPSFEQLSSKTSDIANEISYTRKCWNICRP